MMRPILDHDHVLRLRGPDRVHDEYPVLQVAAGYRWLPPGDKWRHGTAGHSSEGAPLSNYILDLWNPLRHGLGEPWMSRAHLYEPWLARVLRGPRP